MNFRRITTLGTTGTLGILFVKKLTFDSNYEQEKLQEIKNLETWILGIATGQYVLTLNLPDRRLQRWRYADWIVTTPLLLKTFHSLAEARGYNKSFLPAATANIIMIVAGYYAEFLSKSENERKLWYAIGIGALIIVLTKVFKWNQYLLDNGVDTKFIPNFFYIGWSLYGANFLMRNEQIKQTSYNILDLFNKGIYSLHLDSVISDNF